ncbi:hypothetical protein CCR92_05580 [Rhodospirillum rubrum]|nr:hypothetical protein [Rhodospirillum rubrum]HAP99543.1 type II toxin-antitoxin system ParD family antitoxin [Rhodospirillum rubrum]
MSGEKRPFGETPPDPSRKDREREAAVGVLQRAITEGVDSGRAVPFDPTAFKRRMRERPLDR